MKDLSEIKNLLRESQWKPSSKMVDDVCRNIRIELSQPITTNSLWDWLKIIALPSAFAVITLSISFNLSNTPTPTASLHHDTQDFQDTPKYITFKDLTISEAPIIAHTIAEVNFSQKPSKVLF